MKIDDRIDMMVDLGGSQDTAINPAQSLEKPLSGMPVKRKKKNVGAYVKKMGEKGDEHTFRKANE